MRTALIGAAVFIAGVGSAYAANLNPNVPSWSPYAIMGFGDTGPTFVNPGHGDNPGYPPRLQSPGDEGRAAYMEPNFWNDGYAPPPGYPSNY